MNLKVQTHETVTNGCKGLISLIGDSTAVAEGENARSSCLQGLPQELRVIEFVAENLLGSLEFLSLIHDGREMLLLE